MLAISRLTCSLRAAEPEADQDEEGDEVGDEGVGEPGETLQEFAVGLRVEVLGQFDVEDQQSHGEREHRVGQGLEPADRDEPGSLRGVV